MWDNSVRCTFLKLLLMTYFVLCEEFDLALLMEKLENLANKIEMRTKTKHEDIESVIVKLEDLIKTTMDLVPLTETSRTAENELKINHCTDECREKIETVKKRITNDFIHEMVEAVNDEKAQNLQMRHELRDFTRDFAAGIPGADSVLFSYRLLNLEAQLEKLDSKFNTYLETLRKNEKYLQSGFIEIEMESDNKEEVCSTGVQSQRLQNGHISVNDTVNNLKAEIFAVRQEIDVAVRAMEKFPQSIINFHTKSGSKIMESGFG